MWFVLSRTKNLTCISSKHSILTKKLLLASVFFFLIEVYDVPGVITKISIPSKKVSFNLFQSRLALKKRPPFCNKLGFKLTRRRPICRNHNTRFTKSFSFWFPIAISSSESRRPFCIAPDCSKKMIKIWRYIISLNW